MSEPIKIKDICKWADWLLEEKGIDVFALPINFYCQNKPNFFLAKNVEVFLDKEQTQITCLVSGLKKDEDFIEDMKDQDRIV